MRTFLSLIFSKSTTLTDLHNFWHARPSATPVRVKKKNGNNFFFQNVKMLNNYLTFTRAVVSVLIAAAFLVGFPVAFDAPRGSATRKSDVKSPILT